MPAEGPDLDLSLPRRIHVTGVGGAGMSAIATVLHAMGHQVSGSDLKASAITERLVGEGIDVSIGHRADQVRGIDLLTLSPAVADRNVELVEAQRLGVRVVRRAEMLAAIAATRRSIGVAGTHGKTTTSSMLSLILVEAGAQPSFLIGADVNEIGTNAFWGRGEWLVVEADESYGTFRALRPEIALVTNVEPDHLDHYGTFEALRDAFGQYLASASGPCFVGGDDPVALELGRSVGASSVGTSEGVTFQMRDLTLGRSRVGFDLVSTSGPLGRLEIPVPGLHNARNAALAAVAALGAGASFASARTALARFAGVPRRFEFRGEANGVTFVDDYAHLPSEVRATLGAARSGGWQRIVVVFQPHRYTRTGALAQDFGTAFTDADILIVTDVYGAGEPPVPGVSGRLVLDAVQSQQPDLSVFYAPGWEQLRALVASTLAPGDLCLTLGAGDLTILPDQLLAEPSW
jgi:UDP-N-acetylmuramate--alanine ligase